MCPSAFLLRCAFQENSTCFSHIIFKVNRVVGLYFTNMRNLIIVVFEASKPGCHLRENSITICLYTPILILVRVFLSLWDKELTSPWRFKIILLFYSLVAWCSPSAPALLISPDSNNPMKKSAIYYQSYMLCLT